jgi:hypothetical protein
MWLRERGLPETSGIMTDLDKRIAAARELLCSVDGHDFLEMVHSRRCRKCGLKERND